MNIIAQQGFKYSIIGYLGFIIGTFSTLFIFPNDLKFYGKLRFILSFVEMLLPIVVFGISFSNVKFFYSTRKDHQHQNMLSLSLIGIVFNFIIFSLLYFLLAEIFSNIKLSEQWKIKWLILPLILVLAISTVLNKYISNYKKIAIPNIFENLFPKLANIIAFSLFFYLGWGEKIVYIFFFSIFSLAMAGYFLYNNHLENFSFSFDISYFKKNNIWKEILNYSFFGFLGNMGSIIALKVDHIMISEYIGFQENGLYATLYSIISLINIPQMGLYNISAPIINKYLHEHSYKTLNLLHQKTSLNLFFIGLTLFSCIIIGFPYLSKIMKNSDIISDGIPVIWIIGFALLFDLATGFNGHIISLSKYYKFNTFSMLILAVFTIILNFFFLTYTSLGILGIAISYAISITIFNGIKIIFNYYHFHVFPLTIKMLYSVILCGISIFFVYILPETSHHIINLFYKPLSVLIVILSGNYFIKIYPLEKFINKSFF